MKDLSEILYLIADKGNPGRVINSANGSVSAACRADLNLKPRPNPLNGAKD